MEIKAKHLKSFTQKSKGLLDFEKVEPVYFETRFGIHTFLMKEEIDVVILNNDNKIIALKKSLKPNRIYLWNPLYKKVLELPKGTINNLSLKTNSVINLLTY